MRIHFPLHTLFATTMRTKRKQRQNEKRQNHYFSPSVSIFLSAISTFLQILVDRNHATWYFEYFYCFCQIFHHCDTNPLKTYRFLHGKWLRTVFSHDLIKNSRTSAKIPFADTFHDEIRLLYDSLVWSPRFRFWQLAMFTLLEVIALSFTSLQRDAFLTPADAMLSPMFLNDVADYTINQCTNHTDNISFKLFPFNQENSADYFEITLHWFVLFWL